MTRQAVLKITGMHCGGCVASVEKSLKGLSGVSSVKVDLAAGKAVVDYDTDKTNEQEMAKAVKKVGFGVA